MSLALEARIEAQQRLVDKIKELTAQERDLRAEILEECFGLDKIGTVKTVVGNLIVTGEYGLTYKFAQEEIDQAISQGSLSEDALSAIRVKYELEKRVYDQLDDDIIEELSDYLTIKPSLPSLKIKTE